jgi:putative ABC transport system permease protein
VLSRVRAALARVGELFRARSRFAREQDEEFRFHIEMETGENVRRGMRQPEARRAAVLRFGGRERFREETRDARGVVALDNLTRDTRLALRRIRRAPGFAAGVIATLGVGLGVAVGIGTIVYGVLLRDLPYDNPDRLMRVDFHTDGIPGQGQRQSPATYFHFATRARSFTGLGSYSTDAGFAITDGDAPERVTIARVTPNVLTLLGVRPLLGQLFEPGDTSQSSGRSPVLISQELWERRYGADRGVIGRRIAINRGDATVIGVLPRAFDFPAASVSVWFPQPTPLGSPGIIGRYITVIGRLREGVDVAAAAAELNALVPSLAERFPQITPEMLQQSAARISVESLKSATVAPVRPQLVLLGILVGVVLLIATTNVVNLFLLRAGRASQEIAIALSLGASRVALAQRFVVEGIVLGLASAIVALPAAAIAVSTKFGFTEREIPRLHEVAFTSGTVAFLFGCAAVIGAGVGLIALRHTAMTGLFDRLRVSHATPSRAWRGAQTGLVGLQVAIALTLLVAAGLLGRSFWNLRNVDLGFEPASAMAAHVSLPWGPTGYSTYDQATAFHTMVMDRIAALPGVTGVAVVQHPPLTPGNEGQVDDGGNDGRPTVTATSDATSANYFRVMNIPLLHGRTFQPGDQGGVPTVVVSERLAARVFGTTDAVGRTLREPGRENVPEHSWRVIGVVGDVHGERIEDGHMPMMYFPLLHGGGRLADGVAGDEPRDVQYVIRGAPLPAASRLQRIVGELDPRVPVTDVRTLGSIVDAATARVRLTLLLIGVAAAAALLLGVIGVYSVMSYAAAGRVREFGIRLALGAEPRRVSRTVLGAGLRLVAVGTAAGLLIAMSATKLLRSLLYEVQPMSLGEYACATGVLIIATLVAAALPARRAARTDPAVVLRGD